MYLFFAGTQFSTISDTGPHLVYDSDSIDNRMFALPEFLSEIKEIFLEYWTYPVGCLHIDS
jgi:hypothetical protein